MAFTTPLTPAAAAGNAIPIDHVTQLLANTNWLNSEKTFSTWTPTWTNGTLGNGTLSGRYIQFGKLYVFKIDLVWGSTTSSSGSWQFSFPVSFRSSEGSVCVGMGEALDTGTGSYRLRLRQISGTVFSPIAGEGGAAAILATAAPFTWVTGDELHILGLGESG
jgi:hypothetical protein